MRDKVFFISIISAVCSVFLLCYGAFAIDKEKAVILAKDSKPSSDVETCVRNFNIEKADLSNPAIRGYLPYLTEYILCRAAQEDNPRWCNVVNENMPLSYECNTFFNQFHAYFGRLLVAKQLTPRALSACMEKGSDYTEQVCRDMAVGLLTHDSSKCDKLPSDKIKDCRNLVNDSGSTGVVPYVRALRFGAVSSCDNISDNKVQWLCRGALDKNKSSCEKSKGFDIFRRKYCEIISQP